MELAGGFAERSGRFEIASGDHGTTVRARVPLVEAAG
jgi:hypothetical protein